MDRDSENSKKISLGGSKIYSLDKFSELIHGVNCQCCIDNKEIEINIDSSSSSLLRAASFQTLANYLNSGFA